MISPAASATPGWPSRWRRSLPRAATPCWPSRPRSCARGTHDREPRRRLLRPRLPRTCRSELAPDLVIRVGDMVTSKAVRTWLVQTAMPPGGDRSRRSMERAHLDARTLIARADPEPLLRSFAEQLPGDRGPHGWSAGAPPTAAAEAEVDAFLDELGDELFEPRVHRDARTRCCPPRAPSTSPRACRCATSRRFCPTIGTAAALSRQPGRQRDRRAGLVRPGRRRRSRAGARSCCPATSALYHDMNGLLGGAPAGRRGDDRGARTTAAAGSSTSCRSPATADGYEELFGNADGTRPREGRRACTACRSRGSRHTSTFPARWPSRAWSRSPLDRPRNVELHRQLFASVDVGAGAWSVGRL